MKATFLLIISLFFNMMLQAQVSKTVELTAGNLSSLLTEEEKGTITELTLTGTMDARDFKTVGEEMVLLEVLDISRVTIMAFTDSTVGNLIVHPANAIPATSAFDVFPKTSYSISQHPTLAVVNLPISLITIGRGAFYACKKLTSIELHDAVFIVGDEAFMECTTLTSITLPPTVGYLGERAFYMCNNLSTLILPKSLPRIGSDAFSDCISLASIYCYAVNPPDLNNPDGGGVFDNVDKTSCTVYVPAGTRELYENTFEWKDFKNIVEMTEIEVSVTEVTLEAAQGSSASVNISGNAIWTVSWEEPWLEVDPATGTGEKSIILTALETNIGDTVRMCTMTVSTPGVESQTIVVTQQTIPVGVDERTPNRPKFNCYPNPFTEEVNIEIQNPQQEKMTVDIYNLAGQKVKNLASGNTAEQLNLKWDGTNEQGQKVPMGIYLCKMNQRHKQLVFGGQKGNN